LNKHFFASKLIEWYLRHKRDLPWRHTRNPYLIWLSEIILQQTRVKQGMPYYLAFAEKFPNVQDLAQADEREVLRLWQGLGYYARARNMHKTAKIVHEQYQGMFPETYTGLLTLKGIGPYTAAAIASFAFQEQVAVLDGNVFRVLSRLFGIDTDITSHEGKKQFTKLANELIPAQNPDLFNQGMMEFGALLCTPVSPQCMFCPFNNECVANLTGRQEILPVKAKKINSKERYFHYLILKSDDKLAMKERSMKDIWSGLYDFYLLEEKEFYTLETLLLKHDLTELFEEANLEKESVTYTHILTHQKVYAKFWHVAISADKSSEIASRLGISFYSLNEIQDLPKPVLINKYLHEYFF
jgi:A/G-specific adenine glycosylase